MMKDLNVSIIQSPIYWQEPVKNIRHFNKQISSIKKGSSDIIILPEMFTTGFSMHPSQYAESVDGIAMQWMAECATSMNAAVCGSMMLKEKNKFYNRFIWMNPDGTFHKYNKRHLFRLGKEHLSYTKGNERIIVNYKGWNILLQVCYDLRFPVWSRNKLKVKKDAANYDYDMIIYVANWPEVRSYAWQQLLIARSIENQAYVVGVNRTGIDGNDIVYTGDSVILDASGKEIISAKKSKVKTLTASLSVKELSKFRERFPVLMDADTFTIK